MNVTDMIDHVANKAGVSKAVARDAVEAVFDTVELALQDSQEVKFGNIGKFTVKVEGPRQINSFDGPRKIGERRVVRFKTFAGLKERMNPPTKKRAA